MVAQFNPITLIFTSYGLGVLAVYLLKHFNLYQHFENKNYITDKLTHQLGVVKFGWLVKNTWMGMFSKHLKYKGKAKTETLESLKSDMMASEVGHIFGFITMLIATFILLIWNIPWWYFFLLILLNIIFNLYLVFFQQYNKRRIDRILNRQKD